MNIYAFLFCCWLLGFMLCVPKLLGFVAFERSHGSTDPESSLIATGLVITLWPLFLPLGRFLLLLDDILDKPTEP